jgi:hypothetical protein
MFCILVLKVSKVLHPSSVIVQVKFMRSFPYLITTSMTINLTNSLGVRLGVIVDVAVAIDVMAGMVFLITPCVFFGNT